MRNAAEYYKQVAAAFDSALRGTEGFDESDPDHAKLREIAKFIHGFSNSNNAVSNEVAIGGFICRALAGEVVQTENGDRVGAEELAAV